MLARSAQYCVHCAGRSCGSRPSRPSSPLHVQTDQAEAITTEPVLATPRYDRPFILSTDAANTEGIGGVLSQADDDGRERVVAYYARSLTKCEREYTVTEIELLAATESIKHWRPYLWGRRFNLGRSAGRRRGQSSAPPRAGGAR